MKKTLVSALTTALVVGAASTTFAASNPFSDVPADHWAYDAVSQLAADGVIEGYGDSTFRGDRNITRYEMAQMVARAMAKSDVSAADKAMIDKLAAEFADELNNLGVRVANLERNADMVKWGGKLEYTFFGDKTKRNDGTKASAKTDNIVFRLEPSAEVNDHWHVNARLDANYDMSQDQGGQPVGTDAHVRLMRAWAQGDYKMFSVRFGRFSMYGNDDINDAVMSGADVAIGNKNKVSGAIGLGRTQDTGFGRNIRRDGGYDVFYAGVDYNAAQNKGFFGGLRFFRYGSNGENQFSVRANDRKDSNNIWQVRGGYRFDKNSVLQGFYSHASSNGLVGGVADANTIYRGAEKKAAAVEFDYKGAQAENKGTWGAWVAYRHLGADAVPAKTWDVTLAGQKGWEIGGNYTFLKNIIGTLRYGNSKDIVNNGNKHQYYFGRVEWLF